MNHSQDLPLPPGLTLVKSISDAGTSNHDFGQVMLVRDTRAGDARRVVRLLAMGEPEPPWKRPLLERIAQLSGQPLPYVSVPHEGGIHQQCVYLVSDYYEQLLSDELPPERGFEVDTAERLLERLVDGLAALHRTGLAHGDLRLQNIHCTEPLCEGGEPWIGDAAIGPLTWWSEGKARDNQSRRYYAPEQRSGKAEPSPRADLYALGLVAAELFLGTKAHPHRHIAQGESAWNVLRGALTAAGVPPATRLLLARMLADNVERRPADAEDARRWWAEQRQRIRRRRPLIIVGLVVAVSLTLLGVTGWLAYQADQRAQTTTAQLNRMELDFDAVRRENDRRGLELKARQLEGEVARQQVDQLQQKVELLEKTVEQLRRPPPSAPPPKVVKPPAFQTVWKALIADAPQKPSERLSWILQHPPDDPALKDDWMKVRGTLTQKGRLADWLPRDPQLRESFLPWSNQPWSDPQRQAFEARYRVLEKARGLWVKAAESNDDWNKVYRSFDRQEPEPVREVLKQWHGQLERNEWTVQLISASIKPEHDLGVDRRVSVWAGSDVRYTPDHTWKDPHAANYRTWPDDFGKLSMQWQPGQPCGLLVQRYYLFAWRDIIGTYDAFNGPMALWKAHRAGEVTSEWGRLEFDIVEFAQLGPAP